MKARVLIIEDEPTIADTLIYALKTDNFEAIWIPLANQAENILQTDNIDIIILDVGLPDINGFELCKIIRRSNKSYSEIPILFLTARKEEVDRIIGLEIGGDDYVTKPFSPREITARIKTILKRVKINAYKYEEKNISPVNSLTNQNIIQYKDFLLEPSKGRVHFCKIVINLTRYELLILQTLLSNPGMIYSRAQLMDKVWDEPESSFERAVDTHIKSLRAKLREADIKSMATDPIKTHRGMGYSIY